MTVPLPLDDERFYSPQRVAEIFDVRVETVRTWTRTGRLRSIKIGSRTRIPASAVQELAQEKYGD